MNNLPVFSLFSLFSLLLAFAANNTQATEEAINANQHAIVIRDYATRTFGDTLKLTDTQIKQLSWVLENQYSTPEMQTATIQTNIHIEVPRALARLYCLQLLRVDSEENYQRFIAPQRNSHASILSYENYATLSAMVGQLSDSEYHVLEAAAIISSITLSPEAIRRASPILNNVVPIDSVQFLAATAPHAQAIYPLANEVISQYPEAVYQFMTVFMPNSHLRHMMYNEGSLSMYSHIIHEIRQGNMDEPLFDLWYLHWLINLSGFRGHLDPNGSLYLDQNTFQAASKLREIFKSLLAGKAINPMSEYLNARTKWLGLQDSVSEPTELLGLGSLAASLRLFTEPQGQALLRGYDRLSDNDRLHWQRHVEEQMQALPYPAETYAPALFANIEKMVGLTEAIEIAVPIYIQVLQIEKNMRANGELSDQVPVSFRQLASKETVQKLLSDRAATYSTHIDPKTGVAGLSILQK